MNKYLAWIIMSLLLLICAGCGSKKAEPDKPYSQGQMLTQVGSPVSLAQFADAAAGADYIIIAETHSDAHHAQVQADIVNALVKAGTKPVLGLEMLSKEKQGVLDSFNKKKITLSQLPARINWKEAWAFDFSLYQPVIQAAAQHNLPLAALNAPRSTARAVASDKPIPASERKWLPKRLGGLDAKGFDKSRLDRKQTKAPITTSAEAKKTLLEYDRLRTLYESTIADSAVDMKERYGKPVLILVGIESLRNGNFGMVQQLRQFDSSSKILIVLPTKSPDKDSFSSAEAQNTHTQAARSAGNQVYFFCSLPGRLVSWD